MQLVKFLILAMLPVMSNATAMAVSINDLYLYNNTKSSTQVKIDNLPESANTFQLPAHSMCKISQPILFLPFSEESNNFVVMVRTAGNINPIVIDKFGLLTLATDSTIKAQYSGAVKLYSLNGFCDNKLSQSKFLNVSPHSNTDSAPNFTLANCQGTSNYVYFINTQYIKVKNKIKNINFTRATACTPVPTKMPSKISQEVQIKESQPLESGNIESKGK